MDGLVRQNSNVKEVKVFSHTEKKAHAAVTVDDWDVSACDELKRVLEGEKQTVVFKNFPI